QVDSEAAIRGTIRVRSIPGVAPDAAYFRAAYRHAVAARPDAPLEGFDLSGRGHYAGTWLAMPGPEDVRWVIPGVGAELVIDDGSSRLVGSDAAPTLGLSLGPTDARPRPVAAYRWHAVDPIPFTRSLRAALERGKVNAATADPRAAVAVFWYSERPGP